MNPPPPHISFLSLHDALPISAPDIRYSTIGVQGGGGESTRASYGHQNRKSTRLNSSHRWISYSVLLLKKKKKTANRRQPQRPAAVCSGRLRKTDKNQSTTYRT